MNAAARLVHQGVLTRHLILTHLLTRWQLTMMLLTLAVLASAVSIVYVTHLTRLTHAQYQHLLADQDHMQVKRSQLLLERGAWMMQARTQQIAEKQLGMIVPNHENVVVIQE